MALHGATYASALSQLSQGLFNIAIGLEDPFDDTEGLDDVRVEKIFGELEIRLTTAWAPGSWDRSVMYGGSICGACRECNAVTHVRVPALLRSRVATSCR